MTERNPDLRREQLGKGIALNVSNFRTTPVELRVPHLDVRKWIAPSGTHFVPETFPLAYRSMKIIDGEDSVVISELNEDKRMVTMWPRQLLGESFGCSPCIVRANDVFRKLIPLLDRSEEWWAIQNQIDELEPCPDCSREENQLEVVLSVFNGRDRAIEIIHEPMGDVFIMQPGDIFDIAGHRPDPSDTLEVATHDGAFIVFAWGSSVTHVYKDNIYAYSNPNVEVGTDDISNGGDYFFGAVLPRMVEDFGHNAPEPENPLDHLPNPFKI